MKNNKLFDQICELTKIHFGHEISMKLNRAFYKECSYWFNNKTEESVVCSFFLSLLDANDINARLSLSPNHEKEAMIEEIVEDVIPVVIGRL